LGLHVECGDQAVAVGIGGDKAAHRLAQAAAAQQDGGQAIAGAQQQLLEDGQKVIHRIADALTAIHVAQAIKVLPDLRGRGAQLGGQLAGGNAAHARLFQRAQVAVILRQTPDHRRGSFAGADHKKVTPYRITRSVSI